MNYERQLEQLKFPKNENQSKSLRRFKVQTRVVAGTKRIGVEVVATVISFCLSIISLNSWHFKTLGYAADVRSRPQNSLNSMSSHSELKFSPLQIVPYHQLGNLSQWPASKPF